MRSQICSIKSIFPGGGKFSCTLPWPPLTCTGSDVSSPLFSTALWLEADLSERPAELTPKWLRVLSRFGAGRGGLGPRESHHRAPGPFGALFGEHLWANMQVAALESLSSCLLTLGNSCCISRWIEAGIFQGLRDRNLKGLQKPGFSSVGFAAALVSPGWERVLLWAAQVLPGSSPALQSSSKPVPCVPTPTAAQGGVTRSHRAVPWAASPCLVQGGGPRGEHRAGALPASPELVHYKVLDGNNFAMESPLGLFETRLQKKTSGFAILNRRIWE